MNQELQIRELKSRIKQLEGVVDAKESAIFEQATTINGLRDELSERMKPQVRLEDDHWLMRNDHRKLFETGRIAVLVVAPEVMAGFFRTKLPTCVVAAALPEDATIVGWRKDGDGNFRIVFHSRKFEVVPQNAVFPLLDSPLLATYHAEKDGMKPTGFVSHCGPASAPFDKRPPGIGVVELDEAVIPLDPKRHIPVIFKTESKPTR